MSLFIAKSLGHVPQWPSVPMSVPWAKRFARLQNILSLPRQYYKAREHLLLPSSQGGGGESFMVWMIYDKAAI